MIPYPPRELFNTSEQEIFGPKPIVKVIEKIEYKPNPWIWYEGYAYPFDGFVYPEVVYALNSVKRLIKGFFPLLAVGSTRKKLLTICEYLLIAHRLKPEAFSHLPREILRIGEIIGLRLESWLLAMITEYDNAYRYRAFTFLRCFKKHLEHSHWITAYVLALGDMSRAEPLEAKERKKQWERMRYFVPILWIYRNKITEALTAVDWKEILEQEHDTYWMSLRGDFKHDIAP